MRNGGKYRYLVSMTEANQNFSKVAHVVDEKGMAVAKKITLLFYIAVDFREYYSFGGPEVFGIIWVCML